MRICGCALLAAFGHNRETTMENITLAQDVAAIWFMLVFGTSLLAQVFEPVRKVLGK